MSRKQLLIIQLGAVFIGIIGGLWAATQKLASILNYSKVLGTPIFTTETTPVYLPWKWGLWASKYYEGLPEPFDDTYMFIGGGFLVGVLIAVAFKKKYRIKDAATYHGSSRFARDEELEALGLAFKPAESRGVIIGKDPKKSRYLCHKGKEHVFVFAPTRSGKGVGLVIPTLLTWRGSVLVLDIKGENWELTSGWRSQFSHAIYFDPTSRKSAKFNPLLEVRKGDEETRDVRNIVSILADPNGDAKSDFWSESAKNFLTGAILHVLYAEPDKSLPGVSKFLRDPQWDTEERLQRMIDTPHLGKNGPHPLIARAASSLLNQPENTRGGILATVDSYLGVFDDPVISTIMSGESDFRWRDLQFATNPVSLYLVVPPSDLIRLRPILRLLIIQMGGALTEELDTDPNKHRLLLLLDEFPTLGRLDWFESALAYIAGYEIKAMMIAQDLNQIEKAYGANNSILGNCHIRIAFAPNDERTAKRLAEMLGQATETKKTENQSGKKGSFFGLDNVSKGVTEFGRDLMTPGEILQMSPDKELIFVAGQPPVMAEKVRYYSDPHFQKRTPGLQDGGPGKWNKSLAAPTLSLTKPYHDKPKKTENPWLKKLQSQEFENEQVDDGVVDIPAELLTLIEAKLNESPEPIEEHTAENDNESNEEAEAEEKYDPWLI